MTLRSPAPKAGASASFATLAGRAYSVEYNSGYVTLKELHSCHKHSDPVAQLVEHVPFKHVVAGSSPARVTNTNNLS
jgi:hypothetical protein